MDLFKIGGRRENEVNLMKKKDIKEIVGCCLCFFLSSCILLGRPPLAKYGSKKWEGESEVSLPKQHGKLSPKINIWEEKLQNVDRPSIKKESLNEARKEYEKRFLEFSLFYKLQQLSPEHAFWIWHSIWDGLQSVQERESVIGEFKKQFGKLFEESAVLFNQISVLEYISKINSKLLADIVQKKKVTNSVIAALKKNGWLLGGAIGEKSLKGLGILDSWVIDFLRNANPIRITQVWQNMKNALYVDFISNIKNKIGFISNDFDHFYKRILPFLSDGIENFIVNLEVEKLNFVDDLKDRFIFEGRKVSADKLKYKYEVDDLTWERVKDAVINEDKNIILKEKWDSFLREYATWQVNLQKVIFQLQEKMKKAGIDFIRGDILQKYNIDNDATSRWDEFIRYLKNTYIKEKSLSVEQKNKLKSFLKSKDTIKLKNNFIDISNRIFLLGKKYELLKKKKRGWREDMVGKVISIRDSYIKALKDLHLLKILSKKSKGAVNKKFVKFAIIDEFKKMMEREDELKVIKEGVDELLKYFPKSENIDVVPEEKMGQAPSDYFYQ